MRLTTLIVCVLLLSFFNLQAQHGGSSEHEVGEDHHCLFKKNSIRNNQWNMKGKNKPPGPIPPPEPGQNPASG